MDHLETAYRHGFTPYVVDAPVIMADGVTSKCYEEVAVNLKHFASVKIAQAFLSANAMVVLSHFKGHESTGFGGAIKNIGMGCGSRAGKMDMHCAGKPDVDKSVCRGCGVCMKNCAHGAIAFDENRKAGIDHGKCVAAAAASVHAILTPYITATIPPTTS